MAEKKNVIWTPLEYFKLLVYTEQFFKLQKKMGTV